MHVELSTCWCDSDGFVHVHADELPIRHVCVKGAAAWLRGGNHFEPAGTPVEQLAAQQLPSGHMLKVDHHSWCGACIGCGGLFAALLCTLTHWCCLRGPPDGVGAARVHDACTGMALIYDQLAGVARVSRRVASKKIATNAHHHMLVVTQGCECWVLPSLHDVAHDTNH